MGMAASQARFLGLTARKTNTEYEGQQVNQQRTGLANESSSLYSRMVALSVPIPPDTYDYYKNTYTFEAPVNDDNDTLRTYTIKNYTQTGKDDKSVPIYNLSVKYTDTTSTINRKEPTVALNSLPTPADGTTKAAEGKMTIYGEPYSIGQKATYTQLASDVNKTYANDKLDGQTFYICTNDNTGTQYYISSAKLDALGAGNSGKVPNYYYTKESKTNYDSMPGAQLGIDDDGNIYSVIIKGKSYTTTGTNQMDNEAYTQAMNEYSLAKDRYDKEISDINAKTQNIQQQDKTLELRLKQLDTEQAALQTELEAVQKVIEKNVESTFKTFA